MSEYIIDPYYPPSRGDFERWAIEASYFNYHPPVPHAPKGSSLAAGWGIPDTYKPPKDAVDYVIAAFKREVANVSNGDQLLPEYKWSVVSVCSAIFLWLRTKQGAEWVLKFFGTEELKPFYKAYNYSYIVRNGERRDGCECQNGCTKCCATADLGPSSDINLRIFRRCERRLDPMITEEYDEVIDDIQDLFQKHRDPSAAEPFASATGGMYNWVAEQIRNWFLEPDPKKLWSDIGLDGKGRTTGYQWVKSLERSQGVLFFEALNQIELFKGNTYRLQDSNGAVLWCGGADIRIKPMPDYWREAGSNEHQIGSTFGCSSCGKIRTCTPMTKEEGMCCHCYGSIVENNDRPTLDFCKMRECRNCPDHIESQTELVAIKNRLNKDDHFPVRRH